MQRTVFFLSLIAMIMLFAASAPAQQYQSGQPQSYQDQGGWFCPWCGGQSGSGWGGGPGMMGPYWGQRGDQPSQPGWGGRQNPDYDHGWGYGMHGQGMRGYGMRGQGMRGRGYDDMRNQWGRNPSSGPGVPSAPLKEQDVRMLIKNSIASNPNLQVGEIEDQGESWTATVVTRDGSLVDTLEVHKQTGLMRRVQ